MPYYCIEYNDGDKQTVAAESWTEATRKGAQQRQAQGKPICTIKDISPIHYKGQEPDDIITLS